jgi:hypothetical protein
MTTVIWIFAITLSVALAQTSCVGHIFARNTTLFATSLPGSFPGRSLKVFQPASAGGLKCRIKTSGDPQLPCDFDYRAYMDYYPDIRKALGPRASRALVAEHYMTYGYKERRMYKRIPVVFS